MANTKELQKRMKSITDTMKITSAMYMISSSKLRGAKKRLEDTEPYFYALQTTFARFLRHIPEADSIYINEKVKKPEEEKHRGYIVITADKGLAGAYNHNVIKTAHELFESGVDNRLFVVGEVGRHYFESEGLKVEAQFHYTVQNPTLSRARAIAECVVNEYKNGSLDEVHIIYSRMESAFSMDVDVLQLLPLKQTMMGDVPDGFLYEEFSVQPSVDKILKHMVPNFVTGFVYGALVEAFACEQTSRMMAMEAATDSGKEMLETLKIQYNRVRQAAITQEITEVVSGAKAQRRKKKR